MMGSHGGSSGDVRGGCSSGGDSSGYGGDSDKCGLLDNTLL